MFFSRLGFFEGPWELHMLPAGDGYRITAAPPGELFAPEPYPFEGERHIASIAFWCFDDAAHPADPRMVEGLLEIHRLIRPSPRAIDAEVLLREGGHREYLQRVAEDLRDAVRFGHLHIELLPRPVLAPPRAKLPSQRPPAQEKPLSFVAFKLVDQDKNPVPRRKFQLTMPDKDERDGKLSIQGRERFDRVADGSCTLVFTEFDVGDFAGPQEPSPGQRSDKEKGPVLLEGAEDVYEVQRGDTLAKIAATRGFANFAAVWNAPANEPLRRRRMHPNALLPGDQVAIPKQKEKPHAIPTGTETSITVFLPPLTVYLKLLDLEGKPLASAPCSIDGAKEPLDIQTDGNGILEVPVDASTNLLRVTTEAFKEPIFLDVGTLCPAGEHEGFEHRLANLAYYNEVIVEEASDEDDLEDAQAAYQLALARFQDDQSLSVTGKESSDTVDKLTSVSGN